MRLNLHRSVRALGTQNPLGGYKRRDPHQVSNHSGPSGLMAGSQPRSILAMKILVEQNEVLPVGIVLELIYAAIDSAPSLFIAQEDL